MEFLEFAQEFEKRIGIRPGFFNELIREDDWSFVIKLHAFFEACLTHAICSHLGRPELEDPIARLDTANPRCGKIAFIKQLELLNKSQRRYIVSLAELRNHLAHNVKSVDFNFQSYISNLSESAQNNFYVSFSLDEMFEPLSEPDELRIISYVHAAPKFGIARAGLVVLGDLYLQTMSGDLAKTYVTIGEKLVAQTLAALHSKNRSRRTAPPPLNSSVRQH
jgi:hypothetical protein